MRGLVVIPAYQEIESLPTLFETLHKVGLAEDVLVIDDGSTDGSAAWLSRRGITHLRHPFNLGYTLTMETGLLYAARSSYDYVAFLDADGQHDPADLPRLVAEVEQGTDVVIGSRYTESYANQSINRRIGSILFSLLTRLFGHRIRDTSSGYKVLSRRAIEATLEVGSVGDYHAEYLLYLLGRGLLVSEVPIAVRERKRGRSMHGLLSNFYYPLKTLLLILALSPWRRRIRRS